MTRNEMQRWAAGLVILLAALAAGPAAAQQTAPAPAPAPAPAEASPPPAANDAPAQPEPKGYRRWTRQDIARIRAELAAQRAADAERRRRPLPRVYGDAGARWRFGVDVLTAFTNDVGFEHFARDKAQARVGLFGSLDVLTLAPKLIAAVELGAAFESNRTNSLIGGYVRTDLDSQTFHGGIVLRWDALPVLSPMARLWGGASLFQLDLASSGHRLTSEDAVSGFGALGAGFMLNTPPRLFESHRGALSSLGFGLLVEGGYALRSPIRFDLHTETEPRSIRVIDGSLGQLDLSGPYLRVALLVRF